MTRAVMQSASAKALPVSVVIITRNSADTLEECLSSVARNNPAEIIIVDGDSSDATLEIARRYTSSILCDGGKGKGYARQIGTRAASQEFVMHIDSDVFMADHCLETLHKEFVESGCASIHALGELRPQRTKMTYWESAQAEHSRLSWERIDKKARLGTASCIFRRETVLKYGFESGYGGGLDDIDLEQRMRKDGLKLGVSTAKVYFHYRADFNSFWGARFMWGKVAAGYIRKYGPWHPAFWPPVRTLYWLAISVIKIKPWLIPYFVTYCVAETAGLVKAFLALPFDRSRS